MVQRGKNALPVLVKDVASPTANTLGPATSTTSDRARACLICQDIERSSNVGDGTDTNTRTTSGVDSRHVPATSKITVNQKDSGNSSFCSRPHIYSTSEYDPVMVPAQRADSSVVSFAEASTIVDSALDRDRSTSPLPVEITDTAAGASIVDNSDNGSNEPRRVLRGIWIIARAGIFIVAIAAVVVAVSVLQNMPRHQQAMEPPLPPTGKMQDRSVSVTDFINSIKLSPGTFAVPRSQASFASLDNATSEQTALAWLIYNDQLQLSPDTETNQFRLQQRYALLTFLLQFPAFATTGALNENECDWKCVSDCDVENSTQLHPLRAHVTGITAAFVPMLLESTLSPDLGLLTSLTTFDVLDINLMGTIPSSLGQMWTNLRHFKVRENALSGSLPPNMGITWTDLRHIDTTQNSLTGSLTPSFGAAWSNLQTFQMSKNMLKGGLPSTLGDTWTNLESFGVSINSLTGSLPASLGSAWTNLEMFAATFNDLSGSLPSSLGVAWTNLESFSVAHNALTGIIDSVFGNWNNIESVSFRNNSFVGSIPSTLCIDRTASWTGLTADCDEVTCPCCTSCCSDTTGECIDSLLSK